MSGRVFFLQALPLLLGLLGKIFSLNGRRTIGLALLYQNQLFAWEKHNVSWAKEHKSGWA